MLTVVLTAPAVMRAVLVTLPIYPVTAVCISVRLLTPITATRRLARPMIAVTKARRCAPASFAPFAVTTFSIAVLTSTEKLANRFLIAAGTKLIILDTFKLPLT